MGESKFGLSEGQRVEINIGSTVPVNRDWRPGLVLSIDEPRGLRGVLERLVGVKEIVWIGTEKRVDIQGKIKLRVLLPLHDGIYIRPITENEGKGPQT